MANVRSVHADPGATAWQASLWSAAPPSEPVPDWSSANRTSLGHGAWIDELRGWVTDADSLFSALLERAPWQRRTVTMYGNLVDEPRLVAWFDGAADAALPPRVAGLAAALSARYGRTFDAVTAALYRSGDDSVAWHGDRIPRTIADPLVATVSLGSPRRFLLRPRTGGASVAFTPQPGDLLVMGGTCQRTWQHCVPKCRHAGPRISLMFRHSA